MKMAEKGTDGKLNELVNSAQDLFDCVHQAAEKAMPNHGVEAGIWQRVLGMRREALRQFLNRQGDGDLGKTQLPESEFS